MKQTPAVDRPDSASHFYCPALTEVHGTTGNNLTHHFTPKGYVMTCMYCGQTDTTVRREAGL